MRFVVLLFFIFQILLYAEFDEKQALEAQIKSEVYAQEYLYQRGYYKETIAFVDKALKQYPDSVALLFAKSSAYYELKDLENAKKYGLLSMEKAPNDEIIASFIRKIEEQENAKENKAIKEALNYLSDKGFDFLSIFLAFLGGEIISKKYNSCNQHRVIYDIKKTILRRELSKRKSARIKFIFNYFFNNRKVFSFCSFLEVVINLMIVIALLITFLMIELLTGWTFLLDDSLATASTDALIWHSIVIALFLTIITLLIRFFSKIESFADDDEIYIIEMAEQLEKLYEAKEYAQLHHALQKLHQDGDFSTKEQLKQKVHTKELLELMILYFSKQDNYV